MGPAVNVRIQAFFLLYNTTLRNAREKIAKMSALNPLAVLSRGYSAVSDEISGDIVTGAKDLAPDQNVCLRFSDGTAQAKILKIEVHNGEKDKECRGALRWH